MPVEIAYFHLWALLMHYVKKENPALITHMSRETIDFKIHKFYYLIKLKFVKRE